MGGLGGKRIAPQKLAVGRRVTYLCFSSSLCEDLFRETENRAHCTANHRSTGTYLQGRPEQGGLAGEQLLAKGWETLHRGLGQALRSKPRPGGPRASQLT